MDDKINAFLAKNPLLKAVLAVLTVLLGAGRAKGYFAKRYGLLVLLSIATAASAATTRRIELFKYDLDATSKTYFVLGADPGTAGSAVVSAAGSTTLTSAGTPFANVSVGDMLIIKASTGIVYPKTVVAKASASSLTMSTPAITVTSAPFTWRKLTSGTTSAYGAFPVDGFSTFTVQVVIDQFSVSSGGISVQLECRANPNAEWAPAYPVTTPPAAQVPFTATAVGSYLLPTAGVYDACRVGLWLTGTDDGADTATNAEQVSIYTIGATR